MKKGTEVVCLARPLCLDVQIAQTERAAEHIPAGLGGRRPA